MENGQKFLIRNTDLGKFSHSNFDFNLDRSNPARPAITLVTRVKYNFDKGISDAEKADVKAKLQEAVKAWNNQAHLVSPSGKDPHIPIRVVVQENNADYHKIVDVESNRHGWFVRPWVGKDLNIGVKINGKPIDVQTLTHEWGHVLGNYDEYDATRHADSWWGKVGGWLENRGYWHDNRHFHEQDKSLMGHGDTVMPRHFDHVAKTASALLGKDYNVMMTAMSPGSHAAPSGHPPLKDAHATHHAGPLGHVTAPSKPLSGQGLGGASSGETIGHHHDAPVLAPGRAASGDLLPYLNKVLGVSSPGHETITKPSVSGHATPGHDQPQHPSTVQQAARGRDQHPSGMSSTHPTTPENPLHALGTQANATHDHGPSGASALGHAAPGHLLHDLTAQLTHAAAGKSLQAPPAKIGHTLSPQGYPLTTSLPHWSLSKGYDHHELAPGPAPMHRSVADRPGQPGHAPHGSAPSHALSSHTPLDHSSLSHSAHHDHSSLHNGMHDLSSLSKGLHDLSSLKHHGHDQASGHHTTQAHPTPLKHGAVPSPSLDSFAAKVMHPTAAHAVHSHVPKVSANHGPSSAHSGGHHGGHGH